MSFNVEHIHWYWLAGGVLLAAFEIIAPGAVLIWFGVAAMVTGLTCIATDIDINQQFLLFSVLSIGMTIVFKLWQNKHPTPVPTDGSGNQLNQPGSQYVGQEFTLLTDIVDGQGRIKVADTSWRCSGPNIPAGNRVRVIAVESGTLKVEPVE